MVFVMIQFGYNYSELLTDWVVTFQNGPSISQDPSILYLFVSLTAWASAIALWPLLVYLKKDAFVRLFNLSYALHDHTNNSLWKAGPVR